MWPVESRRSSIRWVTGGLGMQRQLLANLATGEISKFSCGKQRYTTSHITLIKEPFRAVFCWNHFQTCILIPLPSIPVFFFFHSFILRSQWGTIGEVFPAVSLSCVALALCPGSREPKQAPRLTATGHRREKPKLHLGRVSMLRLPESNPKSACPLFCAAFSRWPKNGRYSAVYRTRTGVNLTKHWPDHNSHMYGKKLFSCLISSYVCVCVCVHKCVCACICVCLCV